MEKIYKIKAKVWIFPGDTPWHMVTLPKVTAKNIDFYFAHAKRGWGSLPVHVTLGKTNWKTSIFTDKKSKSYILPLKAQVRKQEKVRVGENILLSLKVFS